MLIVEDDPHFARVLLGMVREQGFKGVVSTQGAHARALAHQFSPPAIMLDIFLPDMLGWTVLKSFETGPGDAAHSGADYHASRKNACMAWGTAHSPIWSNRLRPTN